MNFKLHPLTRAVIIFSAFIFSNGNQLSAQVDVDLLSGAVNAKIPVYNVVNGDISVPLVLYYNNNGVKAEDVTQLYGVGWNMTGEVSITRERRGFPDDYYYQGHSSYPTIWGWFYPASVRSNINNWTPANDNNPYTCNDETSDFSYMSLTLGDDNDTEPDMFHVSLPGGGFSFVFDKDLVIRTIPYRDLTVQYTTDPSTGKITSFTVTDENGIKYAFDQVSTVKEYINEIIDPNTIPAFRREYIQFRRNTSYPELIYNGAWYCSSITDIKGNKVIFTYVPDQLGPDPHTTDIKKVIRYDAPSGTFPTQTLYYKLKDYYIKRISTIRVWSPSSPTNQDVVQFTWEDPQYALRLTKVKLIPIGQQVEFTYTSWQHITNKYFLVSVGFNRGLCDQISKFDFAYNNASGLGFNGYAGSSYGQDYWGYINGVTTNTSLVPTIWVYANNNYGVEKFRIIPILSYPGTDQVKLAVYNGENDRVAYNSAIIGSLGQITNSNGGTTQIEYELNTFIDPDFIFDAGPTTPVSGGGIRVKEITFNDGVGSVEVTNYTYNDPTTGVTTGRALSMPMFTLAFPYTGSYSDLADKVKKSTYRTEYAFNNESTTIIYGKVTVQRTNAGKSVYEFNTDGTWRSASVGDWSESMVNVTRHYTSNPNPCNAMLPEYFTNDKNKYPFPPNTNYDFERGLLKDASHYNEGGALVMHENYTYQRSFTPVVIKALKHDDAGVSTYGFVRAYSKYNILAGVSNLSATKTVKTYNSTNPTSTVYTTETETYEYKTSPTDHRLPITVVKTNSNGATYRTRMQYAKEYSSTGTGDDYEKAIHNLKANNINALIETRGTVQQSGGSEKLISAGLTTFKPVINGYTGLNMYLQAEVWAFSSPDGVTDFVPSSISGGVFQKDGRYSKELTINKYDYDGNVVSTTDVSRINKSVIYAKPNALYKLAEVSNAKWNEIGFSNFEFDLYVPAEVQIGFSGPEAETYPQPGRQSSQAVTPAPYMVKTLTNASTNTGMIFSCWIKATASGNLNLTVTCSGCSPANYSVPFTADNNWKYYQIKFPKTGAGGTVYTVTASASTTVQFDDVLIYPDNAAIKIYSYKTVTYGTSALSSFVLAAETGLNGATRSYEYDVIGRLLTIRDLDNNIVEMKTYKKAQGWPSANGSIIVDPNPAIVNQSVTFGNFGFTPSCYSGANFVWNFGDGSSAVTTTSNTTSHTYSTAGTYTVTCNPVLPGYTNIIISQATTNVTVNNNNPPPPPIYPVICAAGIVEKTSSGQCILSYCSPLSAVCTSTKFKLNSITNGSLSDVETVTWQKTPFGTTDWTNIGFGMQTTVTFHPIHTNSYRVRCIVTMTNGTQATSNVIDVINNYN